MLFESLDQAIPEAKLSPGFFCLGNVNLSDP